VSPQKSPPEDRATRSRAYPLIDLKTACDLLRIDLFGMSEPQSREALATKFGYHSAGGGVAARKIAALGHYGIMIRASSGYILSDSGRHLQSLPANSPEFKRLLRSTLEEPVLFRRVFEHYRPFGRVPAPSELAPVLTREKFGITGAASNDAAEVFWRSARFAGALTPEGAFIDSLSTETRHASQNDLGQVDGEQGPPLRYLIPLPSRRFALFEMPSQFDAEDVETLDNFLDNLLEGLRANVGLGRVTSIKRGHAWSKAKD
jgi:hypothetical protein